MFRRRRQQQRTKKKGPGGGSAVVGTEALALRNLTRNSRTFHYPPQGFETRIEYSLLYSMIGEPKIYPEDVVKAHIDQEDFAAYLKVAKPLSSSADNSAAGKQAEAEEVSYAQLSAILALSAEKFPPSEVQGSGGSGVGSGRGGSGRGGSGSGSGRGAGGGTHGGGDDQQQDQQSIPQKLCKSILRTVIRYAESHDPPLDRESEVQELFRPVKHHFIKRENKAALTQILPVYVGYAASIVTGNPVPMLIGATMLNASIMGDDRVEERNVGDITKQTERAGDVERASLLDECEADDL